MPRVSVIIPAYNCGRYLAAAIQSALDQTVPPAEIIVVDDGSTDDTASVAQSFGNRIRYIRQPNAGPAAARNHGAQVATGDWLAFLDADDEWLPWRLEVQLALAAEYPDVVMWCGQTEGLGSRDEGRENKAANQRTEIREQTPTLNAPPPTLHVRFLSLKDFSISNPVATTTVLLRRTAWEQAGKFDPRFRGPEDYDLWMRVAAVGKIGVIEHPLARYREETGSLSMDDRRFLPQVLAVLDKAYGPDGCLHGAGTKRMAMAYQYFSASWMAYNRGDAPRARILLLRSFALSPFRFPAGDKPRWARWKLMWRYLRVTRESGKRSADSIQT